MIRRLFPLAPLWAACASLAGPPIQLRAATANSKDLAAAADAFYGAADVAGLRSALERARVAGPETAVYHELAAQLAHLECRDTEEFEHLVSALEDQGDDAPLLHLLRLNENHWTRPEWTRAEALLDRLSAAHPNADVRALAAALLARIRHARGQPAGVDAAIAATGWRIPLAAIGTWDNDQGKGFDLPQPPETTVDLRARYEGSVVEIGWRASAPLDPFGDLDFAALMSPSRWVVAYAAGAFQVGVPGNYELRFMTTDPIKVWVDGSPVFSERQPLAAIFDQFVIPLTLAAGPHRVLFKSGHRDGPSWRLVARLTREHGGLASGVNALSADAANAVTATFPPSDLDAQIDRRIGPGPGSRRLAHSAAWARYLAGHSVAVSRAEAYLKEAPHALIADELLAGALWENGDLGRTADALGDLDRRAGADLDLLRVLQARFWLHQGLVQKARQALIDAVSKHPDRGRPRRELAELFEHEGWLEERCKALETLNAQAPTFPGDALALAHCDQALGYDTRALRRLEGLFDELPGNWETLDALYGGFQRLARLDEAAEVGEAFTGAFPNSPQPWLLLGDARRRLNDIDGAARAFRRALELNPDASSPYLHLARLEMQEGKQDKAIGDFRAAVLRNPADEATANRLEYLAPAAKDVWAADVPDTAQIEAAVAEGRSLKAKPGADVIWLLDHEVTQLKPDGSTSGVITEILRAVNQRGRDRLLHFSLGDGRTRILHAYAVDPSGRRIEPSSVRSGVVLFRGLDVGSTVVLQYRRDAPPVPYLARNLAREWWFEGFGEQGVLRQWILWLPAGEKLHEAHHGELTREQSVVGDQQRVVWTKRDTLPYTQEPNSPPTVEILANVRVSTVPDWDTFLSWEDALLQDAFRESPELDQMADKLLDGAKDSAEKIARIQTYVMDEIRYQQDYENTIAGVRPHPAPTVVERRYGDCKDKAVLFITLARRAGLKVEYVLVRNRPQGAVDVDVPMQQFNHAIVYVPPQAGVPEGRFIDPTTDAQDLDSIRIDDVGTQALVYDPTTRKHEWREIPFQAPSVNRWTSTASMTLHLDGSADGEVIGEAHGLAGHLLRTAARNDDLLKQLLENGLSATLPGAHLVHYDVLEAKDVRQPARVKMTFQLSNAARLDGKQLRMKMITGWSPRTGFALDERHFPLDLGAPNETRWELKIDLPAGARVADLPSNGPVHIGCIDVERSFEQKGSAVLGHQSVTVTCPRLSPAEYRKARQTADVFLERLDEELVVSLEPVTPKTKPGHTTR
jgi:cellulose synthase operon protein C